MRLRRPHAIGISSRTHSWRSSLLPADRSFRSHVGNKPPLGNSSSLGRPLQGLKEFLNPEFDVAGLPAAVAGDPAQEGQQREV
jgi:hypothetical protein